MAEFSKQWTEKYDPEFGYDFDIEEVAEQLPPNHYLPMICEGFGFIAIGKDDNNDIMLAMPTYSDKKDDNGEPFREVIWKPYGEVIN